MTKRVLGALSVAVTGTLVLAAVGSGGTSRKQATPLPASSCAPIVYKGSGSPKYLIASDLPLEGSGRAQTTQMGQAVQFILNAAGWKAGPYTIGYQSCDDATAQAGKWDSAKCSANANAFARDQDVIGVIGTFNSGCAEIEIPILNRAPDGPVAIISPANTDVGLHLERARHGSRRAGQVLPDREAQLRSRCRQRPLPGRRRCAARAAAQREEALSPERQGGRTVSESRRTSRMRP